mgnify:CR=1 FL=1
MPKSFRLWHTHIYGGIFVSLKETKMPLSFFINIKNIRMMVRSQTFLGNLSPLHQKAQRWMMSTLKYWQPYKP